MTGQFKRAAYQALEGTEGEEVFFTVAGIRYRMPRKYLKRSLYEQRQAEKAAKRASQ